MASQTQTQTNTNNVPSLILRATDTTTTTVAHNDDNNLPGQPTPQERGQGPFSSYPYRHLLPQVLPQLTDPLQPPLEDFEHHDPGLRALSHPDPRSFLKTATHIHHLTPVIGTEVKGVSLKDLNNDERDQLALEVAKRGVMVFRDQWDFINAGGEFWKEFGSHFGRLHVHPTGGYPEGLPEVHMIYRDENTVYYDTEHISTTVWHTDVSWERQPPGLTIFFLLAMPSTGGDTIFSSGPASLRRLSPPFVSYLKSLLQIQSGVDPIKLTRNSTRQRAIRRPPITTIHPLIRKHPVTGEDSLFINRESTISIVGYKKEESDMILNFLYQHVASGLDSQARVSWMPGTVVVWDNRCTHHTAMFDYAGGPERRHGARITPQAERPIPAMEGLKLD